MKHSSGCSEFLDEKHHCSKSALDDLLVVYSVLICDCIFESSFATVSLHRTKRGAVKAMNRLKKEYFYDYPFYDYMRLRYGKQEIGE